MRSLSPETGPVTVLYVDDDMNLLEIGKLFLIAWGFTVDTAESAGAALGKIKSCRYDCIISDYDMPGMNGIGFLQELRSRGSMIPFILFTGKGREEVVIKALNSGADFYLQKGGDPRFQFTELSNMIRQSVQRCRAEEQLARSEKQLAEIIDFLPDATFAVDRDRTVIAWNRAMEALTGIRPAEILGKSLDGHSSASCPENFPLFAGRVFFPGTAGEKDPGTPPASSPGSECTAQIEYTKADGTKLHLWINAAPLVDREGSVICVIESIRDITELVRAKDEVRASYEQLAATEEELRQNYDSLARMQQELYKNEERYRNVVEDQTEFICRFLPDGTLTFVNDAYCRYFDKKREDLVGHTFAPQIPEEEKAGVRSHFASLSKDHPIGMAEHRIILPDGSVRWQQWSDRALFSRAGTLTEYQSVGRDITDRRMAEEDVLQKSEELCAAFAQLTATEEELRSSFDELAAKQQELCRSEQQYRSVVEDQTEFICRFRPDGTHVFINDAYCRYFGLGRDEIIRHRFRPVIPVEDRERVRQFFASLTKEHPVDEIQHRIIMPDGQVRWQRWSDRAIFDATGKIIEYQSVGRDITEIVRAEEVLRENEEQFRRFFRTFRDGIFITSKDGRSISFNDAAMELLGYPDRDELLQVRIPDLYRIPEDRAQHIKIIAEQGFTKDYPVELLRKDGTVISTLITSVPRYDAEGNVTGFQGTIRDVTEQKRTGEVLRESEARYRAMFLDNPLMFFILDDEGTIVTANNSGAGRLGYTPEELKGRSITEIVDEKDLAAVRDQVGACLASPGVVCNRKIRKKRKDGSMIWVEETARAMTGPDAGRQVLVACQDITAGKLSEEAFLLANKKLNLLNAVTRHDVGNNVLTIRGFLEIVKSRVEDPRLLHFLSMAENAAGAVQQQIEFTRFYQEIGIKEPEWMNIDRITCAAVEQLQKQDIAFYTTLEGIELLCDPLVGNVFYNLADNSIRHGGNVTRVCVQGTVRQGSLVIRWEDDGTGIPAAEKELIFQRGYGKNTGFGLFLVREILEITGIAIQETGEPGNGACFEITVPKHQWRSTPGRGGEQ